MSIEVEVHGRNMEVSDRLYDYVTKKVSKLDRYLNSIEEATVELSHVKSARSASDRQVAQITVRAKRTMFRAEERSDDIFAAVDGALERMQRQISKFKGKQKKRRGDGLSIGEAVLEDVPVDADDETGDLPIIIRRKRFTLIPMDEIDAIEQMSLLGHDKFFVFYNINTNSINVLYQRRDGNYGLIEAEIG